MLKKIIACLPIVLLLFSTSPASAETITKSLDGPQWQYQGKPNPSTHWSPWLPAPSMVVRFKFGVRFSAGTIALKCPTEVNFSYDPQQAKGGKILTLNINAKPDEPESGKAFESAFGLYLPNKLQVGFVGVEGVPDILPWKDINYDLWDLLSFIPKAGSYLAQAKDQIGVNMYSGKDDTPTAVPLGETAVEYHDQRSLIDLTDAALSVDAVRNNLIDKIFNAIPNSAKSTLQTFMTDAKIKEKIGKGVNKIAGQLTFTIEGDPYYKLKGDKLILHLRFYVPGKISGTYPLEFNSADDVKQIQIPIPAFATEQDKLYVIVDKITYGFTMHQTLQFGLGAPVVGDVFLIDQTKLVDLTQVSKDLPESASKFEIPLQPSDEALLNYHIIEGCISATARWASPSIPMKGTVKVYKGSTKIAQKTESSFKISHSLPFANLQKGQTYRFDLTCVDKMGKIYTVPGIYATTKTECSYPEDITYVTYEGQVRKLHNQSVTSTKNSITFDWDTQPAASTEVFLGIAPDVGDNFTGYFKKSNDEVVEGYISSGSSVEREITTSHSLTASGLDPGTTYYYKLISWTFVDDDPTKNPLTRLSYTGSIDTKPAPPTPTLRCKVLYNNAAVAGMPVTVTRTSVSGVHQSVLVTGQDGHTGTIAAIPGKTYTVRVRGDLCYKGTYISVNVPSNATQLINKTITLTKNPHPKGYVYNSQGNAVSQATVKIPSKNKQTQTASDGSYYFDGLNAGNYNVQVSKTDFKTATTTANVNSCGLFSADTCVLERSTTILNVTVKDKFGDPLSSTPIQIKQGNTVLSNRITNSQGKNVYVTNYDDNNTHNLTILAIPSPAKIFPAQQSVSVPAGDTMDVEIICDSDSTGPVINIVSLTKSGSNLNYNVNLSESGQTALEYIKPDGQSQTSSWSGTFSTSCQRTLSVFGAPGEYQVKIKARDQYSNISETDYQTLSYQVAFDASIGSIASNSAVVSWGMYPDNAGFKNYTIKMGNQTLAKITNRHTRTYTVTNLSPSTSYTIDLQVNGIDKSTFLAEKTLQFQTWSMPAEITSFTVSPQVLGKNQSISISAQLTDPDTNIGKVKLNNQKEDENKNHYLVNKTVNATEYSIELTHKPVSSGNYKLKLTSSSTQTKNQLVTAERDYVVSDLDAPELSKLQVPLKWYASYDTSCELTILNGTSLQNAVYNIDWGDGSVEQQDIDLQALNQNNGKFTVTHKYNKIGQYDISAYITTPIVSASDIKYIKDRLKISSNDIKLNSETLNAQINIIKGVPREIEEMERAGPDVELKELNLPDEILVGKRTTISVVAKNNSAVDIKGCVISIKIGEEYQDEKTVSIKAQQEQKATFSWTPRRAGTQEIAAIAMFKEDTNPGNNSISKKIVIQEKGQSQPPSEEKQAEPKKADEEPIHTEEPQEQVKPQEDIVVKLAFLELPEEIVVGQRTKIQVQAENTSSEYVRKCKICLEGEDGFKDDKAITLSANKSRNYTFNWTPQKAGKQKLSAYLQSEPQANISARKLTESVDVKEPEPVDVELTEINLPDEILVGKRTAIKVIAKNNSATNVRNCSLILQIGKEHKDEKKVSITAQKEKKTTFYWTPGKPGAQKITATLKYDEDKNTKNNSVSKNIQVKQEGKR